MNSLTVSWRLPILMGLALLPSLPCAEGRDRSDFRNFPGEKPSLQARSGARGERKIFSQSRGGPKRVEVDLSDQRLRAWEGDRLVMQSRISSGRDGLTPTGHYSAGPYKARHHYSSLYEDAYMPWSVQVSGHVFIHGFSSVPNYPASHGCIRLPVTGTNPARRFYEWVDAGTPIRIVH